MGADWLSTNFDAVIPGVCQDLEGSAILGEKNFWWTPLPRLFVLDFEFASCDLAI